MTKILVIEDDKAIRENLLDFLTLEGYELTSAANGRRGLQAAQEEYPDLILCDLVIPELNGYEVLQFIRQDRDLATIPFIFLTGKAEKEYFRQGMELGADDYLTKPFTLSELLRAIEIQLQKRDRLQQRFRDRLQQAENQVDYLLHHDLLVQLPNKFSLQQWLSDWAGDRLLIPQEGDISACVLAIDRFDRLQRMWPQQQIDLILQSVAQRLKRYHSDATPLAYCNINQFVFLLCDRDVSEFARTIVESFQESFLVRNQAIFLTISLGIAVNDAANLDLEDLLDRAEIAKNYAIEQGGSQCQYYTPIFRLHSRERSFIEANLHHALTRQELQVYYQPQVSLNSGEIIGVEALMRWFHPQKGEISPVQFIPIAEDSGAMVEMGEWILKTACEQVKYWQEKFQRKLSLAVNLSVRQLNDDRFGDRLRAILLQTQFSPHSLELELTESVLVENIQLAQQKINELKSLGISIAIDDFGTGYGSLNYLQQLSFDIVKIDRCFIRDLDWNATNAAIVKTIVEMARRLNCRTIAEGVSTEVDLIFLKQQRCQALQGYFFSPPLPPSELTALLETGHICPLPTIVPDSERLNQISTKY
ncbi:putative bifunctional diguanylate cyclase/phosphodiesterase [Spirulina sp. 06S082]|uniref:putative bifunctional diguanylate cyclase/phosphodiesterase n=1 Tax=Spirulina sp. 06S082 TaxID=3110248 RepID=UPI002B217A03|nr:EAL domain-containing protein [Spirulina sp. 06S082]MEA5468348.1 EAL domain-containing protein [Spirulina sp. 06S082]